jgi:hypothetical protein
MIDSDVVRSSVNLGSLHHPVGSKDICPLKGKIIFATLALATAVNTDAGSYRWRRDW